MFSQASDLEKWEALSPKPFGRSVEDIGDGMLLILNKGSGHGFVVGYRDGSQVSCGFKTDDPESKIEALSRVKSFVGSE